MLSIVVCQSTQMEASGSPDKSQERRWCESHVFIFGHYSSKRPIDLDASLVRSFPNICESLIWLRSYEKIKVSMDKLYEEFNFSYPWFCLCLVMLFYIGVETVIFNLCCCFRIWFDDNLFVLLVLNTV